MAATAWLTQCQSPGVIILRERSGLVVLIGAYKVALATTEDSRAWRKTHHTVGNQEIRAQEVRQESGDHLWSQELRDGDNKRLKE